MADVFDQTVDRTKPSSKQASGKAQPAPSKGGGDVWDQTVARSTAPSSVDALPPGAPIQPVTQMTNPKLNIAASGENMPEYVGVTGAAGAGLMGGAALGETPVIGPAMKWLGKKAAPIAIPAMGSYAINQARQWPVVGPIIKHIPFAEMLPWLIGGKGGNAAEGEAAATETVNPAVTSESRTLPGMNPPEVIRPPAQPIPQRSGLMLPGEVERPMPEIPPSRVSSTPPESLSKSARLQQAKGGQSSPTPAVRDMSTVLPRLRQIAQQIQEKEAATPANTSLEPALQKSLQPRIQGKIMQVLRKEGVDSTVGVERLMKEPQLQGYSREQVQSAIKGLRDSGKVWGHEARQAGEEAPSIYGVALRKR